MQTVSDVPVGLFLSGGIDSSSLAGILSRAGIRLNTFCHSFSRGGVQRSRIFSSRGPGFCLEHQEIMVSQRDVLDAIPYALKAMDQPTIDGLNTFLIARQTRAAGIKVALSGLGGDELFAGYSTFRDVPRMERFDRFWGRFPSILRRPLMRMFASLAPDTDQNRKLAALGDGRDRALHPYFLARALFTPEQRDSLLASVDQGALARANAPLARKPAPRSRSRPDQSRYLSGSALLHAEYAAARFRCDEHGPRARAANAAHRSSACRQGAGPARLLETG